MKISRIITGDLKSNCYIIKTKTNKCLIFDPGDEPHKINDYISKNNLTPSHIFLTHGHYDHIKAIPQLKEIYPDVKIAISEADKDCLTDSNKNLSSLFCNVPFRTSPADILLTDNSCFSIDDINVTVISTPGHSIGSVCFLINQEDLITGDTLFRGCVGRTDFYGGSEEALKNSIKKLYSLINPSPENPIKIHPGHWFSSTLQKEYETNPYISFLK